MQVLCCYPDFNTPVLFHVYTDTSDHQLGAVIQDRKPITIYSRKLNTAQKRYTTTEREAELLSAIETCKECSIQEYPVSLPIIVFTDHKNNTFNGLKASDCVLRWLLILEGYGVLFEYLPGKIQKDVVVHTLSLVDIDSLKTQEEESLTILTGSEVISNSQCILP
jgi:hypothetical protein